MKNLFIVILILFIYACVPNRYLRNHEPEICNNCIEKYVKVDTLLKSDTVWIIYTDTLYMPVDTTVKELYFECDSNNNVLLVKVNNLVLSKNQISYLLKNNVLLLKSYGDSIAFYKQTIDKLVKEQSNSITTVEKIVEKEVKKTPWWVWILFGISSAFMLILGLFINKKM